MRGGLWWAAPFVLEGLDIYKISIIITSMENDAPKETILPEPGTYAYTSRLMAEMMPSDDDFDWDAWKDSMKESGEGRL